MRKRSIFNVIIWALALGAAAIAQPRQSRADMTPVSAGYDLFATDPSGTYFDFGGTIGTQNLMGVPLGTFNFGSGSVGVGSADTIVQRTQDVLVGGVTDPTGLRMVALQLETVNPIAAFGNQHLFVTLTPGGTDTGSMIIYNNDTFTSTLTITFDVHVGSLTSTPVATLTDTLITANTPAWSHTAPPGSVLIPGVNYLLNVSDTSTDFWTGAVLEIGPGLHHLVNTPEPSTWIWCIGAGLAAPVFVRWRRRRA